MLSSTWFRSYWFGGYIRTSSRCWRHISLLLRLPASCRLVLCTLLVHTLRAHFSCTLLVHTLHAHFLCTLLVHTSYAHFSCTLYMHTSHAHFSCTLYVPCTLFMHALHAHFSCTLYVHTSRARVPCTLLVHASHAHFSCTRHVHTTVVLVLDGAQEQQQLWLWRFQPLETKEALLVLLQSVLIALPAFPQQTWNAFKGPTWRISPW